MQKKRYTASQRMSNVQSPIIPIVANLINETPDTISLGQGVVYFTPPQSALDRASKVDSSLSYHLYSAVEGIPELRNSISKKLKNENNIDVTKRQEIVVTAGANMAFLNTMISSE